MRGTSPEPRPSLAELLAVLSLGVDLGQGQPMEHMLRQCVIALGVAERAGLGAQDVEVLHYLSLMAFVGCQSDSHEQARWFGDDIALRRDAYLVDQTPKGLARHAMGHLGAGRSGLDRVRTVGRFMAGGRRQIEGMRSGHCAVAGRLALRLGLGEHVHDALLQVFERWDGHGDPGRATGDAIRGPVRIFHLSHVIEVFHRMSGVDGAVETARARRGSQFDPAVVDLFCEHAAEILAPVDEPLSWREIIAGQPGLTRPLSDEATTAAIEAIADYADLKSPYTAGHSRAVADLAAGAAAALGADPAEIAALRRACLLHELGRLGVSNAVWDKEGPLSDAERERARMAPYLTERMVSASPALSGIATLAASLQERLDGSGHPRGLRGDGLSRAARIAAAADVYQALLEPRPHRPERSPEAACHELRKEGASGRFDGEVVEAVLGAAGHARRRRPENPAGLTPREIEVLRLLARGMQSKQIAERLVVSPKTVGHHISHIYAKIGASNRVAASLYATEHGLLGLDV